MNNQKLIIYDYIDLFNILNELNNDLNFALNNYQAKFEIDPTFTDNYISSKWVEILCD